ncbi:MAG TPA: formyltransferase family protein [Gemmatimonadales bacterium]|nr:formyltransferase family protein [Gemmatimonadales bacterium]
MTSLRTVLICHHDAPLHSEGIARWLASWSTFAGTVVVHEPRGLLRRRLRREYERVGAMRLLDVLAGRVYFRLRNAARDEAWVQDRLAELQRTYPPVPAETPVVHVTSPNSQESQRFLEEARPDIILALCKNLLAKRIFRTARVGTFVLHPGICPEYRNAHGCFWALAHDDRERVGMTMLKIDEGVDTGPIFGYFTADFDEVAESHVVIQQRMVVDNLPAIAERLAAVAAGEVQPVSVDGRESRVWGQPWLSSYLRWKRRARARHRA